MLTLCSRVSSVYTYVILTFTLSSQCSCTGAGAQQLSVTALLLCPCFISQVELQHGSSTIHEFLNSAVDHNADGNGNTNEEDACKAGGIDWNNDATDVHVLMQRLAVIYSWARETFQALDLESAGTIDLSQVGPKIFKLLNDLKISHLWESMSKVLNGDMVITPRLFDAVFFLWMGIDEQFESSCQRGISRALN